MSVLDDYELTPVYTVTAMVKDGNGSSVGREMEVLSTEFFRDPDDWFDPEPFGYILTKKGASHE